MTAFDTLSASKSEDAERGAFVDNHFNVKQTTKQRLDLWNPLDVCSIVLRCLSEVPFMLFDCSKKGIHISGGK